MLRLWFVFYWIVNRDPLIKECLLLKRWVYLLRCTVLILVIVLSKILVAKLLGWLGFDNIVLRQIKVQRIEHFSGFYGFIFRIKKIVGKEESFVFIPRRFIKYKRERHHSNYSN